jgi:FMN phosphatase YigB (HAD superfamily)
MKILGISYSWFKGVYSNHFLKYDMTKKPYYKKVIDREKCKPSEIYVFGDSNKSDIVPAKKLGMNGYEIPTATQIPEIVKNALK